MPVASVMSVFERRVAYWESPVVDVYVKSASTADPDCHHQMGSAKRARPGSGYVARRADANEPAVLRRSLAAGTAGAVAEGVADGVTDDVADDVADDVVNDIIDEVVEKVADDVAVCVWIDVDVVFEGKMGESGKKSAMSGAMFEGNSILEVARWDSRFFGALDIDRLLLSSIERAKSTRKSKECNDV